jgi:hypothetical protein
VLITNTPRGTKVGSTSRLETPGASLRNRIPILSCDLVVCSGPMDHTSGLAAAKTTSPPSPSEVPMKPGLLIVKRENWFESPSYGTTENTAATPAVPVPLGEVWRTYRGIDGIPWPSSSQETDGLILSGGVASLDQYRAVVGILGRESQTAKVDLLHIRPSQSRDFFARARRSSRSSGSTLGTWMETSIASRFC